MPKQLSDLTEHAVCLDCGYALAGLQSPACPECGRLFEPANLTTYGLKAPHAPGQISGRLIVFILIVSVLGALFWLIVLSMLLL